MTIRPIEMNPSEISSPPAPRLYYLDAVRAFALILGIFFHASLSFIPASAIWAVSDISTNNAVSGFIVISHSFRLEIFFLIAGYFSCLGLRKQGASNFIKSRLLRIGVPFIIGWIVLRPLIVTVWIAGAESMRGPTNWLGALKYGFSSLITDPRKWFIETHLWFLYYLLMITALTLLLRWILSRAPMLSKKIDAQLDPIANKVLNSFWGIALLWIPTAVVLWHMNGWGMDTPDRSLIPHLPALMIYGGFFLTGWMQQKYKTNNNNTSFGWKLWISTLASVSIVLWLSPIQGDLGHPHFDQARMLFTVSYSIMMWSLVFLTLEMGRKFLNTERNWVRYVADSSYWMYLIHLPIVVAFQIMVAEWQTSWAIKWPFITLLTIGISILTYDLFVRSTAIGLILSGRRKERSIFTIRSKFLKRHRSTR